MWVNPKYKDRVEQPKAPADNGERIATFARGQGVEMRVCLAEYQGRAYISLRVWEQDQGGAWWPVKGKGCSVRMNEAGALAQALVGAGSRTSQARESSRFGNCVNSVDVSRNENQAAGDDSGQGFSEFEV